MTDEQIQKFLNDLSERAIYKGCGAPTFQFQFSSNSQPSGFYCFSLSEAGGTKSEWIYGDTALEVLQKMQLAVSSLATKAEREQAEYLKRLASAIEYGKKVGIDEDFINPLELQMRKLSSNIIEHKLSIDLNDDIPF
jgi:hypothetical protein